MMSGSQAGQTEPSVLHSGHGSGRVDVRQSRVWRERAAVGGGGERDAPRLLIAAHPYSVAIIEQAGHGDVRVERLEGAAIVGAVEAAEPTPHQDAAVPPHDQPPHKTGAGARSPRSAPRLRSGRFARASFPH